jgi:hypothetical protein
MTMEMKTYIDFPFTKIILNNKFTVFIVVIFDDAKIYIYGKKIQENF